MFYVATINGSESFKSFPQAFDKWVQLITDNGGWEAYEMGDNKFAELYWHDKDGRITIRG